MVLSGASMLMTFALSMLGGVELEIKGRNKLRYVAVFTIINFIYNFLAIIMTPEQY